MLLTRMHFNVECSFQAPLVGATIDGKLGSREWLYQCATNPATVAQWAKDTLQVHYSPPPIDEFLSSREFVKFPLPIGPFAAQYFVLHLLCHDGRFKYSLVFHAAHAILDAQVALHALHALLTSIVRPSSGTPVADLPWGEEWENLPAGILTAIGGAPDGWETGAAKFLDTVREIGTTETVRTPDKDHESMF
jgi:hypothetical protein